MNSLLPYWMEMAVVQNYAAISRNLDGVRAEKIGKVTSSDVPVKLGHAEQLAMRIWVLGGRVPSSKAMQHYLCL